ncbi:transposable element Tcb1 transposase [Trichonephila clavipes]|nr:transposable element Tcb1 transposase [Trichonephila clavipes]
MVWVRISLGYRTDLRIFKRGSVTAIRYRDEVLEPIVTLYAAAVDPAFVLMDDNVGPHRADIVDDYLEREAILIELEIVLQEEWRLLNSAVVHHLIESMVGRGSGFESRKSHGCLLMNSASAYNQGKNITSVHAYDFEDIFNSIGVGGEVQGPSGTVSRFHTTCPGFYPQAGKG